MGRSGREGRGVGGWGGGGGIYQLPLKDGDRGEMLPCISIMLIIYKHMIYIHVNVCSNQVMSNEDVSFHL